MNDAQMALLSNIAYLDFDRDADPSIVTLKDLIEYHSPPVDVDKYQETFDLIMADDTLKELKIIGVADHTAKSEDGMFAYCFGTSDNEAIFAFRGTDNWLGNDLFSDVETALSPFISGQQTAALTFVESMKDKGYIPTYATGHSLGGNLAQYVTICEDSFKKCTVFNALGFNPVFVLITHKKEIKKNLHKITCYVEGWDIVSLTQHVLLVNLGNVIPFFSDKVEGKLFKAHAINNFVTEFNNMGKYKVANTAYGASYNASMAPLPGGVTTVTPVAAVIGSNSTQRIKADPTQLNNLSIKMSAIHTKMQELKTQLQTSTNNLDWQVSSKQGIDNRLFNAIKRLSNQCEKMSRHSGVVQTVCDRMTTADNAISGKCKELFYMIDKIVIRAEIIPRTLPTPAYPSQIPFVNLPAPVQSADLTLVNNIISATQS